MSLVEFAHRQLRHRLEAIGRDEDLAGLRGLLAGENMPALGGHEEPAEHILMALELDPPLPRQLLRKLAHLLAHLVHRRCEELDEQLAHLLEKQANTGMAVVSPGDSNADALLDDARYVFNLFEVSSFLPREPDLFAGLHRFFDIGLRRNVILHDGTRIPHQLRRALIHQQADASLRGHWLELLKPRSGEQWTAERRTELVEAWEGVVHLFDADSADTTCAYALLDTGLKALQEATAQRTEQVGLLKLAVARLREAYPTAIGDSRFVAALRPYWQKWPDTLQDVAELCWPALRQDEAHPQADVPMDLLPVWQALPEAERATLKRLRNEGQTEEGRRRLNDLCFEPPTLQGVPPQQVRSQLGELRDWMFVGQSSAESTQRHAKAEADDERDAARPRPAALDRLQALEAANRTLEEVARRLRRGDLEHARRFLDELVQRQSAQTVGDMHLHLAKTLAKAATIARDAGYLDWAEQLIQQAVETNGDDEVAASGLADVLKAQGRLEDAERQYRANIARWPNNEVAANGLADVLKAQGRLDDAERQYRANIARWPNNEVAASGLADVLKTQGRLDDAESQYRANIARWPNDEVAASGLADVLKAQGRLEDAERQYRANIARWPNDEVAASGLADVLKAQDRLDDAESQYRANIARWPNDAVARHGLANVLRRLSRIAEALTLLPKPAELAFATLRDLYDLHLRAVLLADLGRVPEARNLMERGLAQAGAPAWRSSFVAGLAWLDMRERDFARALERLNPDSNVVCLRIFRAHACAADGRRDEARELCRDLERQGRLRYDEHRVVESIESLYGLSAAARRSPTEPEFAALIESEIELALAA